MKGGWKRRFFVLLGPSEETGEAKLEYYESEAHTNGAPKGVILLESVISVGRGEGPRRGSMGKKGEDGETCFRLTTADRLLELVADHPRECKAWKQQISTLINNVKGTGAGRVKEGAIQLVRKGKPQVWRSYSPPDM